MVYWLGLDTARHGTTVYLPKNKNCKLWRFIYRARESDKEREIVGFCFIVVLMDCNKQNVRLLVDALLIACNVIIIIIATNDFLSKYIQKFVSLQPWKIILPKLIGLFVIYPYVWHIQCDYWSFDILIAKIALHVQKQVVFVSYLLVYILQKFIYKQQLTSSSDSR